MNMGGQTSCILIDPEAPLEPPEKVDIIKGPKELPDDIIQEYARATGREVVKLRALSRSAIMGDLAEKMGAHKIGISLLIDSPDMLKDGMKSCDDLVEAYAHDPKAVASIIKSKCQMMDLYIKTGESLISSHKNRPEEPSEKPQNTPPPPLVPVQINIHGNSVSSEPLPK